MASTAALTAAAQDRKSRLAQLKSLKRKQAPTDEEQDFESSHPAPEESLEQDQDVQSTDRYLSGRNYDPSTKGPKLGFETAPSEGRETLEAKAARLAEETKEQARREEEEEKPLDLFKLQPKKANWDLKRDLERKMEVLGVRTDNAIARLVRERLAGQRKEVNGGGEKAQDGEGVGMEGTTLVEATNVREREDEEEARREREEDEALMDAS